MIGHDERQELALTAIALIRASLYDDPEAMTALNADVLARVTAAVAASGLVKLAAPDAIEAYLDDLVGETVGRIADPRTCSCSYCREHRADGQ